MANKNHSKTLIENKQPLKFIKDSEYDLSTESEFDHSFSIKHYALAERGRQSQLLRTKTRHKSLRDLKNINSIEKLSFITDNSNTTVSECNSNDSRRLSLSTRKKSLSKKQLSKSIDDDNDQVNSKTVQSWSNAKQSWETYKRISTQLNNIKNKESIIGKKIDKDHPSYRLTCHMLMGIRISVIFYFIKGIKMFSKN